MATRKTQQPQTDYNILLQNMRNANSSYVEPSAEELRKMYYPNEYMAEQQAAQEAQSGGFFDAIGRGLASGGASAAQGQAQLGNLMNIGDGATANYLGDVIENNQRKKQYTIGEMLPFASDYWTNPEGAMYDTSSMVGSAAVFGAETALALSGIGTIGSMLGIGAGAVGAGAAGASAVARGASMGTRAVGGLTKSMSNVARKYGQESLAKALDSKLGTMFALSIAKEPLELASEAGAAGAEALENGADLSEARTQAAIVAAIQAPLLAFSNVLEVSGLGKAFVKEAGGKFALTDILGSITREGIQNFWEEGMQQSTHEYAQGNQSLLGVVNPMQWSDEALLEGAAGMVGGLAIGGGNAMASKVLGGKKEETKQDAQPNNEVDGAKQVIQNAIATLADDDSQEGKDSITALQSVLNGDNEQIINVANTLKQATGNQAETTEAIEEEPVAKQVAEPSAESKEELIAEAKKEETAQPVSEQSEQEPIAFDTAFGYLSDKMKYISAGDEFNNIKSVLNKAKEEPQAVIDLASSYGVDKVRKYEQTQMPKDKIPAPTPTPIQQKSATKAPESTYDFGALKQLKEALPQKLKKNNKKFLNEDGTINIEKVRANKHARGSVTTDNLYIAKKAIEGDSAFIISFNNFGNVAKVALLDALENGRDLYKGEYKAPAQEQAPVSAQQPKITKVNMAEKQTPTQESPALVAQQTKETDKHQKVTRDTLNGQQTLVTQTTTQNTATSKPKTKYQTLVDGIREFFLNEPDEGDMLDIDFKGDDSSSSKKGKKATFEGLKSHVNDMFNNKNNKPKTKYNSLEANYQKAKETEDGKANPKAVEDWYKEQKDKLKELHPEYDFDALAKRQAERGATQEKAPATTDNNSKKGKNQKKTTLDDVKNRVKAVFDAYHDDKNTKVKKASNVYNRIESQLKALDDVEATDEEKNNVVKEAMDEFTKAFPEFSISEHLRKRANAEEKANLTQEEKAQIKQEKTAQREAEEKAKGDFKKCPKLLGKENTSFRQNYNDNGIELKADEKPSKEWTEKVRELGFHYRGDFKFWYFKFNDDEKSIAKNKKVTEFLKDTLGINLDDLAINFNDYEFEEGVDIEASLDDELKKDVNNNVNYYKLNFDTDISDLLTDGIKILKKVDGKVTKYRFIAEYELQPNAVRGYGKALFDVVASYGKNFLNQGKTVRKQFINKLSQVVIDALEENEAVTAQQLFNDVKVGLDDNFIKKNNVKEHINFLVDTGRAFIRVLKEEEKAKNKVKTEAKAEENPKAPKITRQSLVNSNSEQKAETAKQETPAVPQETKANGMKWTGIPDAPVNGIVMYNADLKNKVIRVKFRTGRGIPSRIKDALKRVMLQWTTKDKKSKDGWYEGPLTKEALKAMKDVLNFIPTTEMVTAAKENNIEVVDPLPYTQEGHDLQVEFAKKAKDLLELEPKFRKAGLKSLFGEYINRAKTDVEKYGEGAVKLVINSMKAILQKPDRFEQYGFNMDEASAEIEKINIDFNLNKKSDTKKDESAPQNAKAIENAEPKVEKENPAQAKPSSKDTKTPKEPKVVEDKPKVIEAFKNPEFKKYFDGQVADIVKDKKLTGDQKVSLLKTLFNNVEEKEIADEVALNSYLDIETQKVKNGKYSSAEKKVFEKYQINARAFVESLFPVDENGTTEEAREQIKKQQEVINKLYQRTANNRPYVSVVQNGVDANLLKVSEYTTKSGNKGYRLTFNNNKFVEVSRELYEFQKYLLGDDAETNDNTDKVEPTHQKKDAKNKLSEASEKLIKSVTEHYDETIDVSKFENPNTYLRDVIIQLPDAIHISKLNRQEAFDVVDHVLNNLRDLLVGKYNLKNNEDNYNEFDKSWAEALKKIKEVISDDYKKPRAEYQTKAKAEYQEALKREKEAREYKAQVEKIFELVKAAANSEFDDDGYAKKMEPELIQILSEEGNQDYEGMDDFDDLIETIRELQEVDEEGDDTITIPFDVKEMDLLEDFVETFKDKSKRDFMQVLKIIDNQKKKDEQQSLKQEKQEKVEGLKKSGELPKTIDDAIDVLPPKEAAKARQHRDKFKFSDEELLKIVSDNPRIYYHQNKKETKCYILTDSITEKEDITLSEARIISAMTGVELIDDAMLLKSPAERGSMLDEYQEQEGKVDFLKQKLTADTLKALGIDFSNIKNWYGVGDKATWEELIRKGALYDYLNRNQLEGSHPIKGLLKGIRAKDMVGNKQELLDYYNYVMGTMPIATTKKEQKAILKRYFEEHKLGAKNDEIEQLLKDYGDIYKILEKHGIDKTEFYRGLDANNLDKNIAQDLADRLKAVQAQKIKDVIFKHISTELASNSLKDNVGFTFKELFNKILNYLFEYNQNDFTGTYSKTKRDLALKEAVKAVVIYNAHTDELGYVGAKAHDILKRDYHDNELLQKMASVLEGIEERITEKYKKGNILSGVPDDATLDAIIHEATDDINSSIDNLVKTFASVNDNKERQKIIEDAFKVEINISDEIDAKGTKAPLSDDETQKELQETFDNLLSLSSMLGLKPDNLFFGRKIEISKEYHWDDKFLGQYDSRGEKKVIHTTLLKTNETNSFVHEYGHFLYSVFEDGYDSNMPQETKAKLGNIFFSLNTVAEDLADEQKDLINQIAKKRASQKYSEAAYINYLSSETECFARLLHGIFKTVGGEIRENKENEDLTLEATPVGEQAEAYIPRLKEIFGVIKDNLNEVIESDKYILPKGMNPYIKVKTNDSIAFAQRNAVLQAVKKMEENKIIVHEKPKNGFMANIWDAIGSSPHTLAEKSPIFKSFYDIFSKAQDTQEKYSELWNKALNEAKLGLKTQQDLDDYCDLMLKGDELGREFTISEVRGFGVSEEVVQAYRKSRVLLNNIWRVMNDARRGVKVNEKSVNTNGLMDILKDNINERISVKIGGSYKGIKLDGDEISYFHSREKGWQKLPKQDSYKAKYSRPEVYNSTETMSEAEYEELQKAQGVNITKAVKREDIDGETVYDVKYTFSKPNIGKLEGYVPHIFEQYFVMDGDHNVIGSAKNLVEATKLAERFQKDKAGTYYISPKTFDASHYLAEGATTEEKEASQKELRNSFASINVTQKQYSNMVKTLAKDMTIAEAKKRVSSVLRRSSSNRFGGNLQQRKGAAGFNTDVLESLERYILTSSRYAALQPAKHEAIPLYERTFKIPFNQDPPKGMPIADIIKEYISYVNGTPTKMEILLNNLFNNWDWWSKHVTASYGERSVLALTSSINSQVSKMKLGFFNVSSALINLTQLMNTFAFVGKNGMTLGLQALKRMNMRDKRVLIETGVINNIGLDTVSGFRGTNNVVRKSSGNATMDKLRDMYNDVSDKGMFFFKQSEKYTRFVSVLSAYYIGLERGLDHKQAIKYAKTVNLKSNFDYGAADAGGLFRKVSGTGFGELMMLFKKYPVKELELMLEFAPVWGKGAKAEKARFWGAYFLFSGLLGFPAADWIDDILEELLGYKPSAMAKHHLFKEFGDNAITRSAVYGAPAGVLGVDVSSRAGMRDMVPDNDHLISFIGGASFSTVNQLSGALASLAMGEGNTINALKAFSPAIGHASEAIQGYKTNMKGQVAYKYEGMERFWKFFGFKPVGDSKQSDLMSAVTAEEKLYSNERQAVMRRLSNKLDLKKTFNKEDMQAMKDYNISKKQLLKYNELAKLTNAERRLKSTSKKNREEFKEGY